VTVGVSPEVLHGGRGFSTALVLAELLRSDAPIATVSRPSGAYSSRLSPSSRARARLGPTPPAAGGRQTRLSSTA
jgi:hypothetical protein